jgi:2'-5' RNA ligase
MPRLFVAAYPPIDVVDALAALPRSEADGVRWVPSEQYHVTVRFLGAADQASARAALDPVVRTIGPVRVVLGPRVSRLGRQVVCVPARGLERAAEIVAAATAELGEPPDPRPFRGHVTLARLRGRAACGLAGARFDASFEVSELHLVDSVTRPTGAEHTVLCSLPLAA